MRTQALQICIAISAVFVFWGKTAEAQPYRWEFSLGETYLQSQENMRYFLNDPDDEISVFPAIAKVLETSKALDQDSWMRVGLLMPIREEIYLDKQTNIDVPHFTFTKSLIFFYENTFKSFRMSDSGKLEIGPNAGLIVPLVPGGTERFLIPALGLRVRISLKDGAGLGTEWGYAGNLKTGTFFMRLGASYRL